jgi:uncharacterized membrane protein
MLWPFPLARNIGIWHQLGKVLSQAAYQRHANTAQSGLIDAFQSKHMQLTPVIATHMSLALTAVAIGPVALWSRLGSTRPRLHRSMGYAWVTCMFGAAFSGLFIRDNQLPNWAGFTPIHLLIPVTFYCLYKGLRAIAQGQVSAHRHTMQWTYIAACVITGLFTLLPQRYLGQLVWGQWLGWI